MSRTPNPSTPLPARMYPADEYAMTLQDSQDLLGVDTDDSQAETLGLETEGSLAKVSGGHVTSEHGVMQAHVSSHATSGGVGAWQAHHVISHATSGGVGAWRDAGTRVMRAVLHNSNHWVHPT